MRGEHLVQERRHPHQLGSSPHARGALRISEHFDTTLRIIPACAGSTSARLTPSTSARDHPRMRGEHQLSVKLERDSRGSSPHARGARIHPKRMRKMGIIPACAGSTQRRCRRGVCCPDHPRMRGEHPPSGPPPRLDLRIIPACAGSTTPGRSGTPGREDHPRMRGEHRISPYPQPFGNGSSPHARGAHVSNAGQVGNVGIIPACAGSTAMLLHTMTASPDHPRMRGEHICACPGTSGKTGSSPHARGAPLIRGPTAASLGIIPACAGSTIMVVTVENTPDGSSPHARGALRPALDHSDIRRIIPACAGSTLHHHGVYSYSPDHPRMRGEHTSAKVIL